MTRLLTCVACLIYASALLAQPARVQTGEHVDFTRVVVTIPQGAEWLLGRENEGYVLRLPVVEGYDTTNFFELIPRDRISAVSQKVESGELRLAVTCDCNADAFLYRPDILVIDVRDGSPAPDAAFERPLDDGVSAYVQNEEVEDPVLKRSLLPVIFAGGSSSAEADMVETINATSPPTGPNVWSSGQAALDTDVTVASRDEALSELEQTVVDSLARAMSQGLLETELDPDTGQPIGDQYLRAALGIDDAGAPGMRASTSIDKNTLPVSSRDTSTQSGSYCLPDDFFDVSSWGDERSYALQIAEARRDLTGEFDRVDADAVLGLARRFVFFGFGREAEQVLALDGINSQERLYLKAIARIIDNDPVDHGLFDEQVSCPASVALWALLAARTTSLDAQIARSSILRAFKTLPRDLQAHLGPQLAERFMRIGDHDAAAQSLAPIRVDPDPPMVAVLAETALTRALGDDASANEVLTQIAENEVRMTIDAMTELLRESAKNDTPVSAENLVLADALRFEHAGLPAAADLAVAQIRTYLQADNFAAAQTLLKEEAREIGPARVSALREEVAVSAVVRMADALFLEFAFENLMTDISPGTVDKVAERLLALGFPNRAKMILSESSGEDTSAPRRYLNAKAALALDDPIGALEAIEGLTTDVAIGIARIADDMRQTGASVADATIAEQTEVSSWRRGDWGDLAQSGDVLLQAASAAVIGAEELPFDPQTPLTSGRALLDQAAQSREIVSDLLDRFTAPEQF